LAQAILVQVKYGLQTPRAISSENSILKVVRL